MRVLLDTDAYSAFKRGHEGVQQLIRDSTEIVFSVVVLGELLFGLDHGWVSAQAIIEYATQEVVDSSSEGGPFLELAGLFSNQLAEVAPILRRSGSVATGLVLSDTHRRLWFNLAIVSLWRHAPHCTSLSSHVESLYCGFDHPADMYHLIGYNSPLPDETIPSRPGESWPDLLIRRLSARAQASVAELTCHRELAK